MMTTPTINEAARLDAERQRKIERAMGAFHQQTVDAARARVPNLKSIDGQPRAGARDRLQEARAQYAKKKDRFLNRATRRANAKLIRLV